MKTEIEIKCENDEGERWVRKLVGNRHKIKLVTGEVINVVTDKRKEKYHKKENVYGIQIRH